MPMMKAEMTEYELEREARIAENQARMAALGIPSQLSVLDAHKRAATKPRTKRPKKEAEEGYAGPSNGAGAHEVRRSRRCAGEKADLSHVEALFPEQREYTTRRVLPVKRRTVSKDPSDHANYDSLNMQRMKTMSEDALRRRVHKITNTAKLLSFIEVLDANGHDELAAEARERLTSLLKNE